MYKHNLNDFQKNESVRLWEQPEESTYYDRKMDLQGEVPGCSMEEARDDFERKYGISLRVK